MVPFSRRTHSDNDSFTSDPAFASVIEKYIEKLSKDDKAGFQSAGDITDRIQKIDAANAQNTSANPGPKCLAADHAFHFLCGVFCSIQPTGIPCRP